MPWSALNRTHWWTRPCGAREVLRISLPLVGSMLSWTVMNFVDRMFLLWHRSEAMAASMLAGMLLFAALCFPLGVATYANTFVAQYVGAGQRERVGQIVWQAFHLGLISTPAFLLSAVWAPRFFLWLGHNAELQALESVYYRIVCWAAGGLVCSMGLSTFFTGRGETRIVLLVDSFAAALNVGLDYVWIFGLAGFPAGGIAGAAWATVASQWARVAAYVWLMSAPRYAGYRIWPPQGWHGHLVGRLFWFGGPEGVRMLADVGAFTIFLLLMGKLGATQLTATTLAFSINSVAFVPILGVSTAVSTLVGQQLGRQRVDLAVRATHTALVFALLYTAGAVVLYVGFPDLLLWGHAAGSDPSEFAGLRATAIVLMRFIAAYCLLEACCLVFVGALRGAGDTRFVLWCTLLMFPIPVLLVGCGLAYWDWGLFGSWTVLTIWIGAYSVIYAARYWQGAWRTMRVIDMPAEHAEPLPAPGNPRPDGDPHAPGTL